MEPQAEREEEIGEVEPMKLGFTGKGHTTGIFSRCGRAGFVDLDRGVELLVAVPASS